MEIYWIKDRKKCGPATVVDVVSMVHAGELTPETQGWHAGCSGWMPLKELPALVDFLNPREPEEDEPEKEQASEESQEELPPVPQRQESAEESSLQAPSADITVQPAGCRLPSARVRLLARLVDMSVYSSLMFIVFYLTDTQFSMNLLPYGPMFWLGLIGMEAVSLHLTGTTPGKRLMGIRVFSGVSAGEQMTALVPQIGFAQALWRSFMVFIGGMGMMAYILPFIMGPLSLFLLKKRGVTSWDARARTLPVQVQQPPLFRYLLAAFIIYASLNIVSTCMMPWIPDMVQMLEQQSPENARLLREMLPPGILPADTVPAAPSEPTAPAPSGIRFLEL